MPRKPSCGLEHARRLGDLVGAVGRELSDAGIDTARLDARLLIAHATARSPGDVVLQADATVGEEMMAVLDELVARRKAREPMSHILGKRGFYDLEFKVTPAVLTPRPDTETLVDAVLDGLAGQSDEGVRILDLGTGSGCLVLSLLHAMARSSAVATDISADALRVAAINARDNGLAGRVRFVQGAWYEPLNRTDGPFDVVVSNPPYIPSADIGGLAPEVRDFEPRAALDGGTDGLDAYRAIADGSGRFLKPGGMLAVEVGAGQSASVATIMETAGLQDVRFAVDLAGHDRVVLGFAPE